MYPAAIGSEQQDAGLDSREHGTRGMQGHAGANLMPLVASNRIGAEEGESCTISFYGSSLIAGPTGENVARAGADEEVVLGATFDTDRIRAMRSSRGVVRDRRPAPSRTPRTLVGRPGRCVARRTGGLRRR